MLDRCMLYAKGGNYDGEVSTDNTLMYRRGDGGNGVLATEFALAALNAAFDSEEREDGFWTLTQVATMDTKVGLLAFPMSH